MWFETVIGVMGVTGLSFVISFIGHRSFDKITFLTGISIGIIILVWIPLLPTVAVLIPVLCMAAILFMGKGEPTV